MAREGWFTVKIAGSMFVSGLPDLYCTHPVHGTCWIECKTEDRPLKDSQIRMFARLNRHGTKIFVLEDERDYGKIFNDMGRLADGNWGFYVGVQKLFKEPRGFEKKQSTP
jgi:hypothetical protein